MVSVHSVAQDNHQQQIIPIFLEPQHNTTKSRKPSKFKNLFHSRRKKQMNVSWSVCPALYTQLQRYVQFHKSHKRPLQTGQNRDRDRYYFNFDEEKRFPAVFPRRVFPAKHRRRWQQQTNSSVRNRNPPRASVVPTSCSQARQVCKVLEELWTDPRLKLPKKRDCFMIKIVGTYQGWWCGEGATLFGKLGRYSVRKHEELVCYWYARNGTKNLDNATATAHLNRAW